MSNLQIYHMNGLIWVNEKQKHYKRRGEKASNKNTKKPKKQHRRKQYETTISNPKMKEKTKTGENKNK